jgi:hypothetical protein
MKKLLGVLVLLVSTGGCFFPARGSRHHGHEAVVERGHSHCDGCGHVQVRGVWYVRD